MAAHMGTIRCVATHSLITEDITAVVIYILINILNRNRTRESVHPDSLSYLQMS